MIHKGDFMNAITKPNVNYLYGLFVSVDRNWVKAAMNKDADVKVEIAISIDGVQKDFSVDELAEKLGFPEKIKG